MSDYYTWLGFRWGFLAGAEFVLVILMLGGCTSMPEQVGHRSAQLAAIGGMPLANIRFTEDGTFGGTYPVAVAAEADCSAYSITFNHKLANSNTGFILNQSLPHEYAHLASCLYRGGMGDPALGEDGDPHDAYWRQWVIKLGGDPDYV
jgi:hypothetical protein